jgi:hypothetical protein
MLWLIFLKTYAAVAALYLAVTAGYVTWRLWQSKKAPRKRGDERELSSGS